MKKILVILLLICSTFGFAQVHNYNKVNFGVRAGMTITNVRSYGYACDFNKNIGPNVGLYVNVPLRNNFFIETGMYYDQKSFKDTYTDERLVDNLGICTYKSYETIRAGYFQIPILFGYRQYIKDNISLDIETGPYIAVGIAGKISTTEHLVWRQYGTIHTYTNKEKDYVFNNVLKVPDCGWQIGAGISIDRFRIGYNANIGFVDATYDDYDNSINYITHTISLGVAF